MIEPYELKPEFLEHLQKVYEVLQPIPRILDWSTTAPKYFIQFNYAWGEWQVHSTSEAWVPGAIYTPYKGVADQILIILNEEEASIQ